MLPGDVIDIPDHACTPVACLYWGDDGTAWALTRTRRKPRRDGWHPYRVVGPVDDPDSFDPDNPVPVAPLPDPAGLDLVCKVFEGAELDGYDTTRMRHAVSELLAHYSARFPHVFDDAAWVALAEAEDGDDAAMVAAAKGVVSWCRSKSPDRMRRAGWRAITNLLDGYCP